MWIPTKFFSHQAVFVQEIGRKRKKKKHLIYKDHRKRPLKLQEKWAMIGSLRSITFPPRYLHPSPNPCPKLSISCCPCAIPVGRAQRVAELSSPQSHELNEVKPARPCRSQAVPGGPGPASPIWPGLLPPARRALQFSQLITCSRASGLGSRCCPIWSSFPFL